MAEALGADLDVRLRWNGEGLDRLLDQAHAGLVDAVVEQLERDGWVVAVEVSFSMWGERGSVDVLAHHPASGIVLVVEVKSVIPDSQSTLHGLDRKMRLAPEIAKTRGWACRGVARVLAIGDSSTSRRRIAGLATTYETAFPVVGREVRRWLRRPSEPISGLLFLPYARGTSTRTTATGVERVRKRGSTSHQPHMPVRRATGNNERPGTRQGSPGAHMGRRAGNVRGRTFDRPIASGYAPPALTGDRPGDVTGRLAASPTWRCTTPGLGR